MMLLNFTNTTKHNEVFEKLQDQQLSFCLSKVITPPYIMMLLRNTNTTKHEDVV